MAKTKALISFAVTTKLICVFVFAYANCLFSHAKAHIIIYSCSKIVIILAMKHFLAYFISYIIKFYRSLLFSQILRGYNERFY